MRIGFRRRHPEPSPSERESIRVRPSKTKPVEVQIIGRRSLDIVNARDISLTGVGLYLPHDVDDFGPSKEVELVISLPAARPFVAKGVVRYVSQEGGSEPHFGVEFRELADENSDRIRHYLASRGVA